MRFAARVKWLVVGAIVLAVLAGSSAAQTGAASPDVVGIRIGMTPQEAYNALKAHSNGAKVGVGQMILQGVSDKPVVLIMSVQVMGASPGEVITLWLTAPPSRQVVWAVRRTLQFDQEHEMLKSKVAEGLVRKYGPETGLEGRRSQGIMDPNIRFWMFDEQGAQVDPAGSGGSGCIRTSLLNLSAPQDPSAPQPITPMFSLPPPPKGCSELVSVRTESLGGASHGSDFTSTVTVILQDPALARRSDDAYQAYLANADAAKRKEYLEKAKQQKTTAF